MTLALLVASALAAPRAQHAFADVFPEGTALWVGVDDLSAVAEGFGASPFGALFADPALAPLRDELARGLAGTETQLSARWGVDLAELRAAFHGAAALGVCEFALPDPDELQRSRAVMALLFELDAGTEEPTLELVDQLVTRFVDGAEQDLSMRFGELDGLATTQVVGFDTGSTLSYTATDGALVFLAEGYAAADDAGLQRWIDALRARDRRDGGERTLAEARDFVDAGLGRVGAAARVRVFARLPALVMTTATRSPRDLAARQALIEEWGLDACGPLVFEQSIDADGLRQEIRMAWGPDFPLGALLAQCVAAGDVTRALEWLPPQVRAAWAVELDPGGAFDALLELLRRFDPGVARDAVLKLAELEGAWGLHPRDDLAEAFDGRVAWFRSAWDADVGALFDQALAGGRRGDPTSFLRTWCFVLGLRDVDTVRGFVDARLRELALHVGQQTEEFEGYRMTAVPLPLLPGLSVTYAFTDDLLVAAFDAELVRHVLRRQANPELPSLADDPAVTAARAELPRGAALMQLTAVAEQLTMFVDLIGALGRGAPTVNGAPVDEPTFPWGDGEIRVTEFAARLAGLSPDAELIARYLGRPNVAACRVHAGGLEQRWILR